MASAATHPPEDVPPEAQQSEKRANGAEIAPLVECVGGGAAAPQEDPARRAAREVAEAEVLLREWERSRSSSTFDLVVQPSLVGQDGSVTLENVASTLSVMELRGRISAEMPSNPRPDEQRLFIPSAADRPLEDETLPIGAYGVASGITLHLAMCDGEQVAARRAARAEVRVRLALEAPHRAELEALEPIRCWSNRGDDYTSYVLCGCFCVLCCGHGDTCGLPKRGCPAMLAQRTSNYNNGSRAWKRWELAGLPVSELTPPQRKWLRWEYAKLGPLYLCSFALWTIVILGIVYLYV